MLVDDEVIDFGTVSTFSNGLQHFHRWTLEMALIYACVGLNRELVEER
jgi:hypothetical protein